MMCQIISLYIKFRHCERIYEQEEASMLNQYVSFSVVKKCTSKGDF